MKKLVYNCDFIERHKATQSSCEDAVERVYGGDEFSVATDDDLDTADMAKEDTTLIDDSLEA